jgi:leucyl aminopeptidase (aminopeptidase T)
VPDPRVEQYARLMVETCLDVQPGWQVMVVGGIEGRPLIT